MRRIAFIILVFAAVAISASKTRLPSKPLEPGNSASSVMPASAVFVQSSGEPVPPPHSIGYPSREGDLDALPGFASPPAGYGEVAFYWWMGDPLTRERLAWQLDLLAGRGISGLQINYAHSDRGGRSYGLTYPSDPPLFSQEWWKLTSWFMKEAKQRGMAVSLSDYTLGFGQGWCVDEILKEHPELTGRELRHAEKEIGPGPVTWPLPAGLLMVAAYNSADGSALDLRPQVSDGVLSWRAPEGRWRLSTVSEQAVSPSIDPMNPQSGAEYVKKFFGRWEEHNPGEGGKGLNFFFSDELSFGVSGNLWTPRFAEEFRRRKGYDLVPELAALFEDIGPRTPKIRMDYRDVMVALEEEGFFKPVFEWHQQRGMIYGCDHGGRGRDVAEFGDYFRTQRWNQGPGSDQPRLSRDIIKAKVASSIAHLYQRPRVWVEGYYGSGWGTTSSQVADATFANFALGYNLLTLHGLYYSTHGGWWEWAPPCNHYHMPYWPHMGELLNCVQRLSYILSQGDHRCDAAILYPVAPMEAGMDGAVSVKAAFDAGEHLYRRGIDFDFIDFESLDRARVAGRELNVSGEIYRTLVLPSMKAVRFSTIRKAVEFQKAGGQVILLGAPPEASDRAGRGDAMLASLVAELTTRAVSVEEVGPLVEKLLPRDYAGPGAVQHRKVGPRDVYMVYGAPRDAECFFRASGRVELWDPWNGTPRPLPFLSQTSEGTRLKLPLSEKEPQLIVFSPGKPAAAAENADKPETLNLEGEWEFELQPSLDNRWGDYRWPPSRTLLGAEARQFRYSPETVPDPGWQDPKYDDSAWSRVTVTFGPKFWKLGPLPDGFDETSLVRMGKVDPSIPVEFRGIRYSWRPYEFSWRWGIKDDPGHQGYHGLKENVSSEFIALGRLKLTATGSIYEKEEGGSRYYLWTSVRGDHSRQVKVLVGGLRPASIWLSHKAVADPAGPVELKAGPNPLLLRYDQPGRGFAVVVDAQLPAAASAPPEEDASIFQVSPLSMFWNERAGIFPFDVQPLSEPPAAWFRFISPPGLRSLSIPARGEVRVWGNGIELAPFTNGKFLLPHPSADPVPIAVRIRQTRGNYGGAAMTGPISFECGLGRATPGDWSLNEGLASYSGGAWYRKSVNITVVGKVVLDLGEVASSAEVRINGKTAGIKVAPPWTIDITALVNRGDNRIEVLVYNTLANHYLTIPSRYRGRPTSGLLGPVVLYFSGRRHP
jgi:hypothetical protein